MADWMARRGSQDVLIVCTIVLGELLFGLERMAQGKRRDELAARLQKVLPRFACEPVTEFVAAPYASIKQIRRGQGLSLDENDLWIAATTIGLSATLVTHDRDFVGVSGLPLEDWTK